jgi:hypothetical protein
VFGISHKKLSRPVVDTIRGVLTSALIEVLDLTSFLLSCCSLTALLSVVVGLLAGPVNREHAICFRFEKA